MTIHKVIFVNNYLTTYSDYMSKYYSEMLLNGIQDNDIAIQEQFIQLGDKVETLENDMGVLL